MQKFPRLFSISLDIGIVLCHKFVLGVIIVGRGSWGGEQLSLCGNLARLSNYYNCWITRSY